MTPCHHLPVGPIAASTCNAGDHLPPHVQIRIRDGREVLVELPSLRVLRGKVSARELQDVLTWIAEHHTELLTQWRQLNP